MILLLLTAYGSVQAGFRPVGSVGGQLAEALLGNSEKMFLPGAFYIESGAELSAADLLARGHRSAGPHRHLRGRAGE